MEVTGGTSLARPPLARLELAPARAPPSPAARLQAQPEAVGEHPCRSSHRGGRVLRAAPPDEEQPWGQGAQPWAVGKTRQPRWRSRGLSANPQIDEPSGRSRFVSPAMAFMSKPYSQSGYRRKESDLGYSTGLHLAPTGRLKPDADFDPGSRVHVFSETPRQATNNHDKPPPPALPPYQVDRRPPTDVYMGLFFCCSPEKDRMKQGYETWGMKQGYEARYETKESHET